MLNMDFSERVVLEASFPTRPATTGLAATGAIPRAAGLRLAGL